MMYRCVRCGHEQGAHDTNLTGHTDRVEELGADLLLQGFELTLAHCTLESRPVEYVAQVRELCDGKSPVQALGIGAGYVSPDIMAEYAEEEAWKDKNQGMWPQAEIIAVHPLVGVVSISG